MLYQIASTDEYPDKPCPKAKRGIRKTEESLPVERAATARWWLDDSSDHRIENGIAYRTVKQEIWVVDLKSLKDLDALVQEVGRGGLLITIQTGTPKFCIEIYDECRE